MEVNISTLENINVLYIEDDKDSREITHSLLKKFTKNQFVAEDGKSGLELFEKNQKDIDLIITDIFVKDVTGMEICKQIRKVNRDVPIIVTSACSNTGCLLEAINTGVNNYMIKPINKEILQTEMSKLLYYHELKDIYTNKLTKLPNRNGLKKDIEDSDEYTIAVTNIYNFRNIADSYGDDYSDKLLLLFVEELKNMFNVEAFKIYHVNTDEFAIVCKSEGCSVEKLEQKIFKFAHKLEDSSIQIDDIEIDINITIGIANGENVLNKAIKALRYSRDKNVLIMLYDNLKDEDKNSEQNMLLVKKLKVALNDGRIVAYFQPIICTQTQTIQKYEALIRYIDEQGNVISPFAFLEIANKARLCPKIAKTMLLNAIEFVKETNYAVSINLSYKDISRTRTREMIFKILNENKKYASKIEFEILESDEIQDFETIILFLYELKKLGCKSSIDDFGAGYSNFSLLTTLDIDYVKIDGSLIKDINLHKNKQIIVAAIVNFAKEFGFKTIAEFVSNEEIYKKIKELGVDYSQGYYFQEPINIDKVKQSMNTSN